MDCTPSKVTCSRSIEWARHTFSRAALALETELIIKGHARFFGCAPSRIIHVFNAKWNETSPRATLAPRPNQLAACIEVSSLIACSTYLNNRTRHTPHTYEKSAQYLVTGAAILRLGESNLLASRYSPRLCRSVLEPQ